MVVEKQAINKTKENTLNYNILTKDFRQSEPS